MTPEQRDRLLMLEQRLLDVFYDEADPAAWPGMATKEDRGDRYWHKKNAMATLAIVTKIQTAVSWVGHLGGPLEPPPAPVTDGASDPLETELAGMEAEAAQLLKKYRHPNDKGH